MAVAIDQPGSHVDSRLPGPLAKSHSLFRRTPGYSPTRNPARGVPAGGSHPRLEGREAVLACLSLGCVDNLDRVRIRNSKDGTSTSLSGRDCLIAIENCAA